MVKGEWISCERTTLDYPSFSVQEYRPMVRIEEVQINSSVVREIRDPFRVSHETIQPFLNKIGYLAFVLHMYLGPLESRLESELSHKALRKLLISVKPLGIPPFFSPS